ncbi:hypothetical protein [Lacihabitans soyangensis]|uniref:CUB domain-containing protein n=1 Tax=Lacihabitans soyangensis TaxID=869394 RepID=A0AAE3KSN6_9BACT|nr:hypothetical protein [Lacihabitans soyangensis]MCP9763552.1 hypothetical protein [Lacihabitans soyangensis]
MKKLLAIFLLLSQYSWGQITLTPNSVGMNINPDNEMLKVFGKGFLIEEKLNLVNVNPNSNVLNLVCPTSTTTSDSAGIVKDPNGNNPYLPGSALNCALTIHAGGDGSPILFTFNSIDLGTGDTVFISGSTQTFMFTGNQIPPPFYLTPNFTPAGYRFYINFKTNTDMSAGQGFEIKYQKIIESSANINYGSGGKVFSYDAKSNNLRIGKINPSSTIFKDVFEFGNNNEVGESFNTTVIGNENSSKSLNYIFGNNNVLSGYYNVAIGHQNNIARTNAMVFGNNLVSKSGSSLTLGFFNEMSDNPQTFESSSDRLFQLGNGNSNTTRSNALTILRNGNVGLGNTSQTLSPDSRLVIDGFTRLGTDAPKIKMKEISGKMPAANANGNYPHGLTDTQILSIVVSAEVNNQFIPPNYTGNPSLEYNYYWATGNLYILNKNLNSSGLADVPFKAFITYKE